MVDTSTLERLDAVDKIRRLIFAYGYYLDRWLYDEVVACFATDAEFHIGNGIFRGRDNGIARMFDMMRANWQAKSPPVPGGLSEHHIHQDIIDVEADCLSAVGRFRLLEFIGAHESNADLKLGPPGGPYDPNGPRQWIGGSLYLTRFVCRDGIWLISEQKYRPVWNAGFHEGWAHSWPSRGKFETLFPDHPMGPDALGPEPAIWPETSIQPYHFAHPVTGERTRRTF